MTLETAKDLAAVIQAVATVGAVVIGGAILGYLRFGWFRFLKPHAMITHDVSHRRVAGLVHLSVYVTVKNSSKVLIRFRSATIEIQRISPSTDEELGDRHREVFGKNSTQKEMQWTTLRKLPLKWEEDGFILEPGETESTTYEFIIDRGMRTLLIRSFLYNERVVNSDKTSDDGSPVRRKKLVRWDKKGPEGWRSATVYDLVPNPRR